MIVSIYSVFSTYYTLTMEHAMYIKQTRCPTQLPGDSPLNTSTGHLMGIHQSCWWMPQVFRTSGIQMALWRIPPVHWPGGIHRYFVRQYTVRYCFYQMHMAPHLSI